MIFSSKGPRISPNIDLSYPSKLLIALLVCCIADCRPLHDNVLRNGNFDDPPVANQSYFELNISGWTCSKFCQIDNCTTRNIYQIKRTQAYANCSGQVIDLNSINSNEVVTQLLNLDVGTFLLEFNFFYPFMNANHKTLLVYFNHELVLSFSPAAQSKFNLHSFSREVAAV